VRSWTFPSSSGTASYTAILADDGKLLCNCKGWTMRRGTQPRHCKHTKDIAAKNGGAVVERGEFVYLAAAVLEHTPAELPLTDLERDALIAFEHRKVSAVERTIEESQRGFPVVQPPAPMLASAMTDPVTGADFDRRYFGSAWTMEEKIDGHRCTVVVAGGQVRAFSRPRAGSKTANVRDLPPHIVDQMRRFPDGIYDGELVAPSGKAWDVVVLGTRLVFVVFDVLEADGLDLTGSAYRNRRRQLLDILRASLTPKQTAITTVESVPASWAGVEAIWQRGGEGVILKRTASHYRPGHRSPDWVKVKQLHAATLTITGFEAGKCGAFSKLCLRDADGTETTVKTLGNALLRAITKAPDSYIGRRVVISYQEKTPGGTYRHGIFDHFAAAGE